MMPQPTGSASQMRQVIWVRQTLAPYALQFITERCLHFVQSWEGQD